MTDDALDQLVADLKAAWHGCLNAGRSTTVLDAVDAITALRERVAERSATIERLVSSLEKDTATMERANKCINEHSALLAERDRRIAALAAALDQVDDLCEAIFVRGDTAYIVGQMRSIIDAARKGEPT